MRRLVWLAAAVGLGAVLGCQQPVVSTGASDNESTTHGWSVREDAHDIGATPYLLVEALQGVVGPDLLPVGDREAGEGQDVRTSLVQ